MLLAVLLAVLLQLSLRLQGRTSGAPRRPAQAETREAARDQRGERERARQCRTHRRAGGGRDSRRRWGGSLARFLLRDSASSRAAARRADAPHPAAVRTS